MSYVLFFFFLFLSVMLFAGLRALKDLVIYRRLFEIVATVLAGLPIIVWVPAILIMTLLIYPAIGFLVFIVIVGLVEYALHVLGLSPAVESLAIWSLLPGWAWYLVGSAITGTMIYWFNRPNRSAVYEA